MDALILYTGEHHLQLANYYITELFDILYANNVEQDLLIKLEMKYLKILDHNGIPRAIKKELSTPASAFFSDIVKILYGEEGLDDDEHEKRIYCPKFHGSKKMRDKTRFRCKLS